MSPLPEDVLAGVEAGIREATGRDQRVVSASPVSGGCINDARLVLTDTDRQFFLKHNPAAPPGLFQAEARGLRELSRTGSSLRIPEVVGQGPHDGHGWLLLEYVAPGPATASFWTHLGSGLAELHSPIAGDPGLEHDNFIGPLPQSNAPATDWGDFWLTSRIRAQLDLGLATGRLDPDDDVWRRFEDAARPLLEQRWADLVERGGGALLHGDLWSGNVYPDRDGTPVLIDPAVYRGDPEVDLAMTRLFGGFDVRFHDAYDERASRLPDSDQRTTSGRGDRALRRGIYQLYPLLVHANLFGAGYAASARSTALSVIRG